MKRIIKKLNSSSGNTLMMALLFMLIAMVISVILLSGAAAAARRVKSDKSQQQAYLALSSAAQLMRDGIADDGYTVVLTKYERRGDSVPEKGDNVVTEKAAKEFGQLLNDAVEYVMTFNAPYVNEQMAIKMNGVPSVSVKFKMDVDYSIRLELSIDDAEGFESMMTVSIDGDAEVTKSYGSIGNEYDFEKIQTSIKWSNGIIGKGTF